MCEWEEIDLLLIAGDLFHRQPLLRELKELNYLFSKLSRTKVVFIVGNHDYLKPESFYHSFQWEDHVYPLLNGHMGCVELPELKTCVYGMSYHQKEITESLYDHMRAPRKQEYEILLAHGGDSKHIPFRKEILGELGYDYIALGHIHKPQVLLENQAIYAGALEPIDKNDVGPHGYVQGEMTSEMVSAKFIPNAKREYIHFRLKVNRMMTSGMVKEEIQRGIQKYGTNHMYKIILSGLRDADIVFDLESMMQFGNIFEILDETKPEYQLEKLLEQNQGNLLGRFISQWKDCEEGSIEQQALYEGVQALMETKRGEV